jgi:hypothetical protein
MNLGQEIITNYATFHPISKKSACTRGFTMRNFLGQDILTLEDKERNEIFHILSVTQELGRLLGSDKILTRFLSNKHPDSYFYISIYY